MAGGLWRNTGGRMPEIRRALDRIYGNVPIPTVAPVSHEEGMRRMADGIRAAEEWTASHPVETPGPVEIPEYESFASVLDDDD